MTRDEEIHSICFAYEQGYGHANTDYKNPYSLGSYQFSAWAEGKKTGEERSSKPYTLIDTSPEGVERMAEAIRGQMTGCNTADESVCLFSPCKCAQDATRAALEAGKVK